MAIKARTDEDVRREIIRRVREGEPRKAVAIDLGIAEPTVGRFTAHLPGKGPKRDARTKAIVDALEAGDDPRAIATRTKSNFRTVMAVRVALLADD